MKNNLPLILLFIILSAALYAFVTLPMYGASKAKYDHIEHLQETLLQGEELQEKRDTLLSERNSISQDKRNLLERAIVRYSFSEVVRFVIALNAMLGDTTFGAATPYSMGAEQPGADGVITIPITFVFDNIFYYEVAGFINKLREWERGVRIVSLQITSGGDESEEVDGNINATITIEALFSNKPEVTVIQ